MSVDKDEITLTKFSLIYFLGDVDIDLRNLFNEKYIQKYIHKESRNTFLTFGRQLQEKITDRIDNAIKWIKIQLDLMNTKFDEFWKKLQEIDWTGIERDFKIKVWERFRGGLDKGWIWLHSKFSIINTLLGSLSSAGVPGVDAISEINDAYEAAKK